MPRPATPLVRPAGAAAEYSLFLCNPPPVRSTRTASVAPGVPSPGLPELAPGNGARHQTWTRRLTGSATIYNTPKKNAVQS